MCVADLELKITEITEITDIAEIAEVAEIDEEPEARPQHAYGQAPGVAWG
jgi:hypothetical protein